MMRTLLLLLTIFATGTDAGNGCNGADGEECLCTDRLCDPTVGCACPPGGTLESLYEHSGCPEAVLASHLAQNSQQGQNSACLGFNGAGCPLSHPEFMSYDTDSLSFTCCSSKVCSKELTYSDEEGATVKCSRRCPPPPPVATMCQMNYNSTVTFGGTNMKVKFELCEGWPKDGKLTIVPPGGYSISEDTTATMSASGVTGGLSVLVNDETITISRDAVGEDIETNPNGHEFEIEITGVAIEAPEAPSYHKNFTEFAYTISAAVNKAGDEE